MTTLSKQAKNRAARMTRDLYNTGRKIIKSKERNDELVAIGKTLIPKEVPTGLLIDGVAQMKTVYDFPKSGPKNSRGRVKQPTEFRIQYGQSTGLAFLSGKGHIQHGAQRKTRPGEKELHTEALVENGLGVLARTEAKARAPKPTPDIPVIDVEQPIMGEYAEKFAEPQQ